MSQHTVFAAHGELVEPSLGSGSSFNYLRMSGLMSTLQLSCHYSSISGHLLLFLDRVSPYGPATALSGIE